MEELMIKVDNVSKQYRLGQIGGTTLRDELQRRRAKRRGQEDPTRKIGARSYEPGDTFLALDGVSFTVNKGERVGIIGRNGAGKSTLLKLLSRITAPTSGFIGLNGRIASMLEVGTGFHPELTGRENVYMNGAILGMTRKEIDRKIEDIIDFSEVRQFIDTPVKRYSSGMYVKLAFSVAAHLDSEIMIMDEVLAVGDVAFQKKCLEKMSDVSKTEGRTVLYVSHNMSTIRQLCSRVIVLDHGHIIFDGGVEEGISVYLGQGESENGIIDYATYERDNWFHRSKIRLQSLRILSTENRTLFERTEELRLELILRAKIKMENVGFRLEIRDETRAPLCASNTYGISLQPGDNVIRIAYDLSVLSPGPYHSVLTVFSYHDGGGSVIEDWIPGFSFTVEDTRASYGKVIWNRVAVGCIILPEGKLLL